MRLTRRFDRGLLYGIQENIEEEECGAGRFIATAGSGVTGYDHFPAGSGLGEGVEGKGCGAR
jgi:hypothetical protein